ncbi:protein RKD1 [Amborella trichopoda]|nr:protein RKD1 [Amborella trichopoda]|eukprot:XP_006855335.2 protein RKD1 [Amborella trichopoda]
MLVVVLIVVRENGDNFCGSLEREEERERSLFYKEEGIRRVEKCSGYITYGELSRYFYMPITQAAKVLKVGLTVLKKKCREFGIPRWPHRKMKSLQSLVQNVQELGKEDGEMGEEKIRNAIKILEEQRNLMEKMPGMQLAEKTKKLRQACFKANYKRRRHLNSSALSSSSSNPIFSIKLARNINL